MTWVRLEIPAFQKEIQGMRENNRNAEAIFDRCMQLQLLQLETRRRLAERISNPEPDTKTNSTDDSTAKIESIGNDSIIPEEWRLLPPDICLHDWQKDCLKAWLPDAKGTVKVATGCGKTIFALAAAEKLQNTKESDLRLVIVVPTIALMEQWQKDLSKSNIPPSAIGYLGHRDKPKDLGGIRILVCVLNSARIKLPDLVQQAGWAEKMLLIVDECHRTKAEHASKIFESKPRYTLGLSATPESLDEDETLPALEAYNQGPLGKALGPIIYELSLQEAHAAGLLSSFEIFHVGLELMPRERQQYEAISREISDLHKPLKRLHDRARIKQPFIAWCQTRAKSANGSGHHVKWSDLQNTGAHIQMLTDHLLAVYRKHR
jgi:superfamily II DNA or RNA helicase